MSESLEHNSARPHDACPRAFELSPGSPSPLWIIVLVRPSRLGRKNLHFGNL